MDEDPKPEAPFDVLLDHLLRGDVEAALRVLASIPALTPEERRQIANLAALPPEESGGPPRPSPPGPDALAPPIPVIDRYRLGPRIGSGATGVVFLARDETLGRDVAVKILGPDLLGGTERGERFLREIRAVAKLKHPNIVTVHTAGEHHGLRYMAMELVRGKSLHEVLAEAGAQGTRPRVTDALRWGIDIAGALQAAHDGGVLHRDVKPSNIRIADDGRAVLLDFGLAVHEGAATLTESGAFRGSPQYASPEQVGLDGTPIDARTDVYSLGATLYEAVTGVAPFRGATREQLFHHILARDAISPRKLDAAIPRDLETVILTAMAKEPERRYRRAADLAADLEAVRDGRPPSVRPPSALWRLLRHARRHRARAALVVTLAVAVPLVAALGFYVVSNREMIEQGAARARALNLAAVLGDAFIEYGEGDPREAERLFAEALRLDPASHDAMAGLALAQIRQGEHERALAFLGELGARGIENTWRDAIRADALARLGRPRPDSRAIPAPASATDHFVAGMMDLERFHRGDKAAITSALVHLRQAVYGARTPNALYHSELGHAAWHADRHDEARQIAEAIGGIFPASPEHWFSIGRTLLAADRAKAWDAFEKAARPPPRSLQARTMIVIRLAGSMRKSSIDIAVELGRDLVAEGPGRAASRQALGVALLMRGDLDGAIAELRAAADRDPENSVTFARLAEALVGKGDLPAAAAAGRTAVELDGGNVGALNALGVTLLRLGQVDEAVSSFEAALQRNAGLAEALCNLGRALLLRGEFARGLESLRAGHDAGSRDPRWSHPSERWIRQAERLVALERDLEQMRSGTGGPAGARERLAIALEVCRPKQDYAEAAGIARAAFAADPALASGRVLLEAAEAAFAAGVGRGHDAPEDGQARTALRDLARSWFAAELDRCERHRDDPEEDPGAVKKVATAWLGSKVLAATRDESPASVTATEAEAWKALFARAAALANP
jgi:tetratricopeptide (TPR) repeat protein